MIDHINVFSDKNDTSIEISGVSKGHVLIDMITGEVVKALQVPTISRDIVGKLLSTILYKMFDAKRNSILEDYTDYCQTDTQKRPASSCE